MDSNGRTSLEPPNAPFRSRAGSLHSLNSMISGDSPGTPASVSVDVKGLPASLSVNYLPSKFSNTMLSGGPRRRKVWKGTEVPELKRGGGRRAFKTDEARMRIPGRPGTGLSGHSS